MNRVVYFVEGECEKQLINALKENPAVIHPGKVKKLNVMQEYLTMSQLVQIQTGTIVVLVFDTDVPASECFNKNIERLKSKCTNVEIVYLLQVLNLEDELVRCSVVKRISELTQSLSDKDFKRDFCAATNVRALLKQHRLDVSKLWTQNPPESFNLVERNSERIKLGTSL